jgi:hypothetical protein
MRSRSSHFLLTVGFLLVIATQFAHAQLVNENLLVTFPPGYKVGFQDKKPNLQMTEMVPDGEAVKDWSEMVTVQIFFGMKATPEQFKDRIANGWIASCKDGRHHPVDGGAQNGYPTLTWVLSCPLNSQTGKPEITWFKAVQGNDSFYLVQKAFKFMPNQEQATRWLKYLTDVKVCDSRLPDRRCPQTR